jgi:hypothetical protein
VLLWTTIALSAFLVVESLAVRIILLAIAVAVTVHVLWLRTARPARADEQVRREE